MKLPFLPRRINAISYLFVACSMTGAMFALVGLAYAIPRSAEVDWFMYGLVAATVPFYYLAAVWYHKRHEKRLVSEVSDSKDFSRGDRTKNGPTPKRKR